MDELSQYNKARWEEIAATRMAYARPFLDLDPDKARQMLDTEGLLGDVAGKEVLCLASGGGQQSVAFALLGARVTVFDLTETQLERDREAAAHYGIDVGLVQGDMRDLRTFSDNAFDIVWQPYSINFVPDTRPVLREVARVLRQGGLYHLACANPFAQAIDEAAWDGSGYPLKAPYVDGAELTDLWSYWDVEAEDGRRCQISSPREFRHTLSTMINGLTGQGFVILRLREVGTQESEPEPGSWEHYKWFAPPYINLWSTWRPSVFGQQ